MCTISVIRPTHAGPGEAEDASLALRLVSNRDELRSRPASEPPRLTAIEGVRVAMPIDPAGQGTWIAAAETGLIYALLNAPDVNPAPVAGPSRGEIIPRLAGSPDLDAVASRLAAIDWRAYRGWRLLVLDGDRLLEASPRGSGAGVRLGPVPPVFMTTSSSVAEREVARRRTRLFRRLLHSPSRPAQDAFHRHQWAESPELSVLMSRPEACTVSRTVVDVTDRMVRLTTTPLDPPAPAVSVELRRIAAWTRGRSDGV